MINKDTFSSYHPSINFIYFALVLILSMCVVHPVYLVISLSGALCYSIYLKGKKAIAFSLRFMLPTMIIAAVFNPVFNHEGVTIISYLPSGNPLTLESILYGISAAVMIVCILTWFTCYNEVMTSDKFVYLFGKLIPALSLVLSMTLRFVPKFKAQAKTVSDAQRMIGRDVSSGSAIKRIKCAVTIMSIMITWSLENAIESADSMKSRGYGLPGRTAFSIYRFDERDRQMLCWLLFCGFYLFAGYLGKASYFRYYPSIKFADFNGFNISFMFCYLLLCLTPVIVNIKEDRVWKHIQYGI